MKSIYEYIDYRLYLRDYFAESKAAKECFSHRWFAQKAGLGSPVFMKMVMDGKRNLTQKTAGKILPILGLNKKEQNYFYALVRFNQAKISSAKQQAYASLRAMRPQVKELVLETETFDYFSRWYVSVVRELICIHDYGDDYEGIAKRIRPRIKSEEAKWAVDLLQRLGFIVKDKNGKCRQASPAITTGSEVTSMAVRKFHHEMIGIARQSLDRYATSERNVQGLTIGISRETFEILNTEIEAFRERVVNIVNDDSGCDAVYQLNVQLFPMTSRG